MRSVKDLTRDLDSLKATLRDRQLNESELAELDSALRQLIQRFDSRREVRSLLELKGLGKDFWRSIDVESYIRHERESWD